MEAFHQSTTLFQTPFLLINCRVSIINSSITHYHSHPHIMSSSTFWTHDRVVNISITVVVFGLVFLMFGSTILWLCHCSPLAREEHREAAIEQANQHARANRHALRC